LGIPAVYDRVCQQALRNRLEPIFDDSSFGYRPGRSAKGALRKVWREIEAGAEWIVDADLRDYFGTLDHDKLMTLVARRVADGRVLTLIEQMLQPDPALAEMLGRLGQKRVIFTNSYLPHVERVLRRLGVEAGIDQVIDIVTLDFVNKPKEQAYQRALELSGEMEPAACVIVDDRSVNLGPAVAMGMRPVLVDERGRASDGLPKISRITQLVELLPELLA